MKIIEIITESKTVAAAKPRNFVAKNAKMGGAGKMKDKSKTLPRHEKHKKPVAEGADNKFSVADKVEELVRQYKLFDKRGWSDLFAKLAGRKLQGVAEIRREMEYASKFLDLLDSIRMRSDYRGQQDPKKDQELIDLSNQWLSLFNKATGEFKGISGQGVAEGSGGDDTVQSLVNIRSTVKQIQTGKAQYPQGFASQLEVALYDAINALRDNPDQGAQNTVKELAGLRAIAKQVQTGKATFPQGYTSRLEWVLYDAIKQIENSSQGKPKHVKEGSDDVASATPAKNERGRFTAWDDDEPMRLKCEDGEFRTIQEINMLRQKIGMKPFSIKSQQGVAETRVNEKAVSKAQQKFMGMVYAAKKGEKPASPEVAKVAKGMTKKAAHDYAATKHKGKPDHVKEDDGGGATAGSTSAAMVGVGAVYKNKRAKMQKPGTNALDMKGGNLMTGGSIAKR